jgi:multiple sugar transport system substrate-binding protein
LVVGKKPIHSEKATKTLEFAFFLKSCYIIILTGQVQNQVNRSIIGFGKDIYPMKHTKLLSFALVTALLLTLGVAVVAQDTTTLTLTWWGSDNRHERTIEVIEMFEAEHPEIDIEYEYSSWGDYWTRVNTQVSAGAVACVMQHDYAYQTEWAKRGLLLPLDDLIEEGKINVEDVAPAIINSGRVLIEDTDNVYGISLGSNSQVYIIDADAFEEAGLEIPPWDWTWDDFEELGYQMYDNTGRWMIAYGPWDDNSTWAMLVSAGQMPWNADGTAIDFEDAPLVEYWARLKRMMDYGAIPSMEMQADVIAESPSHEQSPIIRSEEAIRYQWSNQVVSLVTAAMEVRDFNYVLQPLPRVPGGQVANYLKPSMFFSITEGCETVDEAAMFIDYFTNSPEANEVLFAERGIPIAPAVLEHLTTMADDILVTLFDYMKGITEIASPIFPPNPAGYTDISNNVFSVIVDEVLYGQISPEEGVAQYKEQAQAILDENQ